MPLETHSMVRDFLAFFFGFELLIQYTRLESSSATGGWNRVDFQRCKPSGSFTLMDFVPADPSSAKNFLPLSFRAFPYERDQSLFIPGPPLYMTLLLYFTFLTSYFLTFFPFH